MMQDPKLKPFLPMIRPMLSQANPAELAESLTKVKRLIDFVITGGVNPFDDQNTN